MPGKDSKKRKDLYLGKCMADLNKLSECKDLGNNVTVIVKSADKTFREAVHQDELADEERAYVLYMRYFNVIQMAKKKPDYFKQKEYFNNLIGNKNQMNAIDRAEALSKSLKERYDLVEAEAVVKKLATLEEENKLKKEEKERSAKEKKAKEEEKTENGKEADELKSRTSSGAILPMELFNLMNDKQTELIVMDLRREDEFRESHISHKSCINVPEEVLPPGCTVAHITKGLPAESRSLWNQRGNVDHVILLDWRSTMNQVTIGSPLRSLKDALFKYDATVILKSEPLVLDGGYEQWVLFYPTITTNAHAIHQIKPEQFITSSGLDFDYPDFEEPSNEQVPVNSQSDPSVSNPLTNGSARPGLPSVNRSLKPKPASKSVNEAPLNNKAEPKVKNFKNTNIEPATDKLDGFPRIENSLYPDVGQVITKSITRTEPKKVTNIDTEMAKFENDDVERELTQLSVIKRKKEEELLEFKAERQRMVAEHKARIAKLEEEEEKLRKLETLRRKEEKDVAKLMRMKRDLQDEMKKEQTKLSEESQQQEEEEQERLAELDRVRKLEEEKRRRREEEVERLRKERRIKEEDEKVREQAAQEAKEAALREAALRDAAARAKQEEEDKQLEIARATERAEALRQEEERARQKEEERARQKEEEERKREADKKRREEMKIQQLKKEKEEQEKKLKEEREKEEKAKAEKELADRLKHEEAERAKAERDQKLAAEKLRAEEARKIAEQKMRAVNETKPQWKMVPSTNLPVGWEKRLDRSTNRYFYINHNQGTTQWEPPVTQPQPPASSGSYTTKLKEEPTVSSSRGLSRSFSSPDIMKLMNEEANKPFISPNVDRTKKPSERFEPPVSKPVQRQYIVKKRDLNPVYGSVGPALTGLRNLGNTCYMNSTIQCLNNCTPLVAYFLNDLYLRDINRESSEGMHGEMVDDYAIVLKALWNGQYRCITPRDLKTTVGKYNPMFAGTQQQDSQEFLTFLLDGLHEGLNEVKTRPQIPDQENDNIPDIQAAELAWKNHKQLHRSIIVELFQGQLKSTLQCRACMKTSVTFQAFMFLSLPIPSQSRCSLRDCIHEFLKPEMMTGSCKWKCPRCRVERDAVKKIDIWKLPPILLIGLNRFVSDGMWMQKTTSYVDFPITDLDMREYVGDPRSRTKYNLYGISNHYGTMEGGHYTANCRNPCSKKWYKFDDSEVYEMSRSDVKTSAAYVLFYTSIELTAPKYSPQL